MVLDVLDPMFKDGTADLMNLHYIAWGKVRRDGNQLNCQHGPDECQYNRYINCAQKYATDQNQWFPYVKCLAQDLGSIKNTYSQCATDNGLNAAQLDTCANGDIGAELEAAAGKATEALSPNLTFVPWIVVNGVSIGSSFEELQRYVCAATTDIDKRPAACSDLVDALKHMG
jgi:interferon gamma-inducible protein 30